MKTVKIAIRKPYYDIAQEIVNFMNDTYGRHCIEFKTDLQKLLENMIMEKANMFHEIRETHRLDEIKKHEGSEVIQ